MVKDNTTEIKAQRARLAELPPHYERYLDEKGLSEDWERWRKTNRTTAPDKAISTAEKAAKAKVASAEPSVMGTFKANVRKDEPESGPKDYRAAYEGLY